VSNAVTSYLTVADDGAAEIEVRRSRFLCRVRRVHTEDEARAVVDAARRAHWEARHHCSAFVRRPGRGGAAVLAVPTAEAERLARTVAEVTGGRASPVVVGQDWVDHGSKSVRTD
jgi:putative IMPACT (imprinted ancient) family translation regulator